MWAVLFAPEFLAAGSIGAFIGSQVDDLLDPTPQESGLLSVNYYKMALYALGGVAVLYGVKRILK